MKITELQTKAAYEIASQVYDNEITQKNGANKLQNKFGLNINSARDYINDYKHLLNGKLFKRTMSAPSMDFFLTNIAVDHGSVIYSLAISSLEKHIEYYEKIGSGNLISMRDVAKKHKLLIGSPMSLVDMEIKFEEEVRKSISDSPDKRKTRLSNAAKQPTKITVTSQVFIRNPDVVAEVMHRAAGVCENCSKPAPFFKKKDGKPYLEIHHKIQLSDDGEDTVQNAIALCPNCHRKLHFGI